jgi:hypothetical protein
VWGATVYLPPNTEFEYKFIRKTGGSVRYSFARALWRSASLHLADILALKIVWESDPNRQDTTPASGVQLIATTSWR